MKVFIFFLIFFCSNNLFSQNIGSISGRVVDAKLSTPLVGASIILEGTSIGSISDQNGYFKIYNIPTKTYNIKISYIGFETKVEFNVIVKSLGTSDLLIRLYEKNQILDEITVSNNLFKKSVETPLSIQSFSSVEIETYPGGNNDITKVAQSLPGISPSVGGFRNDFIIRGGAPNETVYYLDGIEIPNINHFSTQGSAGGPVGMVNIDFVREVTLSTSSFGAEYDNPLSGVLVFEQREGNNQEFSSKARLGASEAGITINTPLFKKQDERSKTTFMLSARRSYLQYIFKLIGLPIRPDYWDYQFKIHHEIDDYNSINFLGLGSIDDFYVEPPIQFDPESQSTIEQVPIIKQKTLTLGVSWIRKYKSGKGLVTTTLSSNKLRNDFSRFSNNIIQSGIIYKNDSKEQESKLRVHFKEFKEEFKLSYGFNLQYSSYFNKTQGIQNQFNYYTSIDFFKYGFFGNLSRYFLDDKLSFSFGIRSDGDTFTNGSGLLENISPRISMSYQISNDQKWRLNSSVGRYFKIPTYTILGYKDSSDNFINKENKYIQSDHYVLGLEYNWTSSSRITIEGFIKDYDRYPVSIIDQVSLANKGGGFEILGNEPISDNGNGRSYGLELLFQQKLNNNFYGIFALTHFYSRFSNLDGPNIPTVWDSRNLISFTGGYKLKRNWEISLRYRYAGRTPYPPLDYEESLKLYPILVYDYNNIGNQKIGVFSQADLRIDKKWNFKNLSFNFFVDLQNFLAQINPQPEEFGLERNTDGSLVSPKKLVSIQSERSRSPIPSFGFVFDF
jgi:hypothetical protein|tara:strand:+ start:3053 stop:5407 length:2355 start_codon:yes stop_codon:yes gene_type:complete